MGSRVCCCCRILNIIYFYTCTYERVSLRLLQGLRSAVVDNIRRRIVGVMFPPSIFEDRCVDFRRSMIDVDFRRSMCRPSKIDVTMCRPSEIDVSTFEDRCVDLRRWMCRPSKTDDRCVDLRRSIVDVSTFEHRWSM